MKLHRISVLLVAAAASVPAEAQVREPFPSPIAVEHHIVDGSLGGTPVAGETVRDTYGGSFLVSERTGGDRTIVDFARREVTEVKPKEGTYWSLSFGRFADLRRRLEEAESLDGPPKLRTQSPKEPPVIRVEEPPEGPGASGRRGLSSEGISGKRLRASVDGGPALEVWVDPSAPRLTPEAISALADFERTVLGSPAGGIGPAELLEAVRKRESGALAVRTRRAVAKTEGFAENGPILETIVTKVTPLASVPPGLVTVPEGLRRVPSPLEVVVSWAEDEAALRQRGRR